MTVRRQRRPPEYGAAALMRALADQAFSRAAGAPLVEGNGVRLLKDSESFQRLGSG